MLSYLSIVHLVKLSCEKEEVDAVFSHAALFTKMERYRTMTKRSFVDLSKTRNVTEIVFWTSQNTAQ